jgi:hypothetical protein
MPAKLTLATEARSANAALGAEAQSATAALGAEARSAKATHATPPAICGLLSPKRCAHAWRVRAR